MADVRLGWFEAREGRLPPVCLRCGAPASVYRNRIFWRLPWWFYAVLLPVALPAVLVVRFAELHAAALALVLSGLPFLLLVLFCGRRVLVRAPLCELHKDHWRGRVLALFGLFAAVALTALAAEILLTETWTHPESVQNLGKFLMFLAAVVGPPLLLGAALTLKYTGIYATEITAHTITLTGVVSEFIEAVRVARRGNSPDDVEDVIPHPAEG